jgi:hypothetical protein
MGVHLHIAGTIEPTFQIGLGGSIWKNTGGVLEAKDSADNARVGVHADHVRIGTSPVAVAGDIRVAYGTVAMAARNPGDTADATLIQTDAMGGSVQSWFGQGCFYTYFDSQAATYVRAIFNNGVVYVAVSSDVIATFQQTGVTVDVPLVQFGVAVASPTIKQLTRTTNAAPQNLTIQPQWPFDDAGTTGSNRKPGDLVVALGAPVQGATTEARLVVTRNGSFSAALGPYESSGASYTALYMAPYITPSSGNYSVLSDTQSTYINTPHAAGAIYFSIAGGTKFTLTGTTLEWASTVQSPNYAQTIAGTVTSTPQSMFLTPQAPHASADQGFRVPGNLVVALAAPVQGETAEARLVVTRAGVFSAAIGPYDSGGADFGTLWLGPTPNGANYTAASHKNGYYSYFNVTNVAGVIYLSFAGSASYGMNLTTTALTWAVGTASPTIGQAARTTSAVVNSLTLKPQWAWADNGNGGNNKAGDLVVSLGPPVNSATAEARFVVKRNNVFSAALGPYESSGSTHGALYLAPGITPDAGNYSIATSSVSTLFNAPSANGALYFCVGTVQLGIVAQGQLSFIAPAYQAYISFSALDSGAIYFCAPTIVFRDGSNTGRFYMAPGTTTYMRVTDGSTLDFGYDNKDDINAAGANLTIRAQNNIAVGTTGGSVIISSGTGTTAAGSVSLQYGGTSKVVVANGYTQIVSNAANEFVNLQATGTGGCIYLDAPTMTWRDGSFNARLYIGLGAGTAFTFAEADTSVTIGQVGSTTASVVGAQMTIGAQYSTGTNGVGGKLVLSSGLGATAGASGNVELQTGSTTRLTISPTAFTFGLPFTMNANYIAFGSAPSATGCIRTSNATVALTARNFSNTGDIHLIGSDIWDNAYVGYPASGGGIYMGNGAIQFQFGGALYVQYTSYQVFYNVPLCMTSLGAGTYATIGHLRAQNDTVIIGAINFALNADLKVASTVKYAIGGGQYYDWIVYGDHSNGINVVLDVTNTIFSIYSSGTIIMQYTTTAVQWDVPLTQWDRYQTPTLQIQPRYEDATTHLLSILGQAPMAGAVNFKDSGGIYIGTTAPVAGGTAGTVQVGVSGAAVTTWTATRAKFDVGIATVGQNNATVGDIRVAQASGSDRNVMTARDVTNARDMILLYLDTSNNVHFGNLGAGAVIVNDGAASVAVYVSAALRVQFLAGKVSFGIPIEFTAATVSPSISQLTQTSDTATNGLFIQAQGAYASSTVGNRAGGTLVLKGGKSVGDYTYEGYIQLWGGTRLIGSYTITNADTNNDCRFTVGSTCAYFLFAANEPGQAVFFQALGAGGYIAYQTENVYFYDKTPAFTMQFALDAAGSAIVHFAETTTPTIRQAARTSDAAVHDFTIQPQWAWNNNGNAGNKKPGDLIVSLGAPANAGTAEARLVVKRNSVFHAALGPYETIGGTYSALYLGPGLVPSTSNYNLVSDGSTLYINAPGVGAYINFVHAGAIHTLLGATEFIWANTVVSPVFMQSSAAGVNGQTLSVQAQNITGGGNFIGGKLVLTSGTANTAGNVEVQTGGVAKLTASPTTVTFSVPLTLATAATIRDGTGSPESAVTANVGSLFLRTDGSQGTTLYTKENGNGNTGWAAVGGTTPNWLTCTGQSTTYGASAGDFVLCTAGGSGFTVTLPAAASNTNKVIAIKKVDSGQGTITVASAGGNVDGQTTQAIVQPNGSYLFVSDGTDWWAAA